MTHYGSIYMAYGTITEFGVCGTHQRSALSPKGRLRQGGSSFGDNGPIQRFPTTGVPIHGGGTEEKAQGAGTGTEDRVYREAPREPRGSHTARCGFYRGVVELFGLSGPEDILAKKGVWPESAVRSKCSTSTIASAMRRSHRSTGCLFRKRDGR